MNLKRSAPNVMLHYFKLLLAGPIVYALVAFESPLLNSLKYSLQCSHWY